MDVARLNFSHGTPRGARRDGAAACATAAGRAGRPVAILQDLPGPKLRIGPLREDRRRARARRRGDVRLRRRRATATRARMTVGWPGSPRRVEPGEVLYLADGRVRLRVDAVRAATARSTPSVEIGGTVASRQGLNMPGETRRRCPPSPRRTSSCCASASRSASTSSRCRSCARAEDITSVRKHTRLPLIAKIEKPQAVEHAEEILRAADCVMVARGDLGIELPIEEVPIVQKQLLALAGQLARPVDHGDADARLDGHLLAPDARRGGRRRQRDPRRDRRGDALPGDGGRRVPGRGGRDDGRDRERDRARARPTSAGTRHACAATRATPPTRSRTRACEAARELELDALVIPTLSGRSARLVSAHRPSVPIYALSPGQRDGPPLRADVGRAGRARCAATR